MKKVGKSTRPFSCDLDLFTYDYAVEVTNKFKGLDLMDRVPDELWREVPDTRVWPQVATHSSTLAWQIPWTAEPGRLQSMGWLGVGHD